MARDPTLRENAMSNARKSATEAIALGYSSEQVLKAAHDAIKKTIYEYKPTANSIEKGLENALRVRDEFMSKDDDTGDKLTAELEINDYPINARQKVISKEFLGMIYDLTNSNVTVRGVFCEPTKKVITGQKKLYLHIAGDNKFNVASAYREIKRVLEDAAMMSLHSTGAPGKYTV